MSAGTYSFIIEKGATTEFRIEYKDSNSNPIDLTYYHARMHIRPSPTSTIVYVNLSSSLWSDLTGLSLTPYSASIQLPKSSGSIGIYISAASSSLILSEEAYYDLELVSGSSANDYVIRLMEGRIKVKKNVTR